MKDLIDTEYVHSYEGYQAENVIKKLYNDKTRIWMKLSTLKSCMIMIKNTQLFVDSMLLADFF